MATRKIIVKVYYTKTMEVSEETFNDDTALDDFIAETLNEVDPNWMEFDVVEVSDENGEWE